MSPEDTKSNVRLIGVKYVVSYSHHFKGYRLRIRKLTRRNRLCNVSASRVSSVRVNGLLRWADVGYNGLYLDNLIAIRGA